MIGDSGVAGYVNIVERQPLTDGEQIDINAKKILKDGQKLQDFGLQSGDQVYVSRVGLVSFRNASLLISGLGLLATVAAIFITRN